MKKENEGTKQKIHVVGFHFLVLSLSLSLH